MGPGDHAEETAPLRRFTRQPAEGTAGREEVSGAGGVHGRRDRRDARQRPVGQLVRALGSGVATTVSARPRRAIRRMVRSGSADAVVDGKTMSASYANCS